MSTDVPLLGVVMASPALEENVFPIPRSALIPMNALGD